MCCYVVGWMSTDVSGEPVASIFFEDRMNLGAYLPQHHTQEDN
jgi:hypothetical protein